MLVVMSGYNDPAWSIDEAIVGVVDEARSQGVRHVVWLSLRTNGVDYSDPQEQTSVDTFRGYNASLIEAAAASGGFLQVADWATYSTGSSEWFESDGVHLTARGVDALTSFIADRVGHVLAGEDVSPAAAPWTVLVPGAEGEVVAVVQAALIDAGIDLAGGADGVFGNDTMAAVAGYQRGTDGLQVTGAVDESTARSLGVYADEGLPVALEVMPPASEDPAPSTAAPVRSAVPVSGVATPRSMDDRGAALPSGFLVGGIVAFVLGLVLFGWRRSVVAQRRERRWARVHPATSPLRSVADMRRGGALPAQSPSPAFYDRRAEEPEVVETK